jgi:hypothetical protein
MGVEDDDRLHVVLGRDGNALRQPAQRGIGDPLGDGQGLPQLVAGVVVGALDGGAGQRVVELVEEQAPPRPGQLRLPIGQAGGGVGHRRPQLRPGQGRLGPAVQRFDAGVGGVAAPGVVLELTGHRRQGAVAAGDGVEEGAGSGADDVDGGAGGGQVPQRRQVASGRTAAVVPDSVEHQHRAGAAVRAGLDQGQALPQVGVELVGLGVVAGQPAGDDLGPVGSPPGEDRAGQVGLVAFRALEEVARQAAAGQQLREGGGVTERVGVPAHRGHDPEVLGQEPLPHQGLADERLSRRQVAVGLHPPAAGQVEPARGHQPGDVGEEGGVRFPHPLQEDHRREGVDELGELAETVDGGAQRGPRLGVPLRPGPQPHGVEMGVSDHVGNGFRPRPTARRRGGGRDHVYDGIDRKPVSITQFGQICSGEALVRSRFASFG